MVHLMVFKLREFILFFLLFLLVMSGSAQFPATLLASDNASLQLAVASPDPVQSGSEIMFQVILANNGTEKWEAGRYYFEVQIYNSDKFYLVKTARILGDQDVAPGSTALSYIPFQVPENFGGVHFYRIFMTHNEKRVYEGGYSLFSITPIAARAPEEKPVTFGGNAVISAQSYSKTKSNDVLRFNLNTVGQVYGRSMLFNLNTQTTKPAHSKIIQVLLTYYGPLSTLNLGDVQPNFSPLSYANSGARGMWVQMPVKNFSTELIGVQSVFKVTGSSSPARTGTFARYVIGLQEKVDLPHNFTVSADYVTGFDDKNSLSADSKDSEFRGPNPTEAKNDVKSGGIIWKGFSQKLSLEAQYAQSEFRQNTLGDIVTTVSSQGKAMRMGIVYKGSSLTTNASLQRTDSNFIAFMAPSATADRLTLDMGLSYSRPLKLSRLGVTITLNRFTDNVDNSPSKITTTQNTYLLANSLSNPKPWPGLGTYISINQGQDNTKAALDNQTQTLGLSVNQPVGNRTNLTISVSQSQFKDLLKNSQDVTTVSESFGLTSSIGTRITLSLGASLAKATSLASRSVAAGVLDNNSYSASVNWQIRPEKLYAQFWFTLLSRSGTSSGVAQNGEDTSNNAELTYQVNSRISTTLGGSQNKTTDAITPANNTSETVTTIRVSYSF